MENNKLIRFFSFISTTFLGLMFLVSAFAKAWDADTFAHMLLQYGPKWFTIGAPLVIMTECVLGISLLFRARPRWAACAADIFLLSVSAIFAYGMLAKGIEDCGCFGALSKLYTAKPWMTFVRNAGFILISVPALLDKAKNGRMVWPGLATGMGVAVIACFICGLAMRRSFELPKLSRSKAEQVDHRAEVMDKLQAVYPFDTDSTYVVYLFSFSCAYCQNSFANVQQYHQLHVVDKVIGIAIDNEKAKERFYRLYQPQIDIITIPNNTMAAMTNDLPLCLLIKEGQIKKTEGGFITSPGIFIK